MKALSILLCFLIGSLGVYAKDDQASFEGDARLLMLTRQADSLKRASGTDTMDRLVILPELIRVYQKLNVDSAVYYAQQQLALAEGLGDDNKIAYARYNVASMLYLSEDVSGAKQVLLKNRDMGDHILPTIVSRTEALLTDLYISTEEYDQAIKSSLVALETFKQLGDSSSAGFVCLSLAEIHALVLDDYEQGVAYLEKAISFLSTEKASKERLVAAYISVGEINYVFKKYGNAMLGYQQAESVAVANDVIWYNSDIMNGYGKVYYERGDYDQSIYYMQQAIDHALSVDHEWKLIRAYEMLGMNYLRLNSIAKAVENFEYCLEHETTEAGRNRLKKLLVECYQKTANYKLALELQQEVMISEDSIIAAEQKEKVAAIVENYEGEKKQSRIEQLRRENEQKEDYIALQQSVLWGVLAIFLILLIGGYSWLRTRQKLKEGRVKIENAQLRQRFLRVQLNPHFFFHALSSIEAYIYANEQKRAAGFLRDFSKLMRGILETSDQDFVPLKEDLNMIREYLKLQQLNNDFKFEYEVQVDDKLDVDRWKIPPMLIQPFVENAILHGALNVPAGRVKLGYAVEGEFLEVQIEDNGPQKSETKRKTSSLHRSMSTQITRQRIANLREVHGVEIRYTSESGVDENRGSVVSFRIPAIAA